MTDEKVPEQIEVILRSDEQLEFIQQVLQRSEISHSLQFELQQQIDKIKQRQKDTNLYLAVIGEFSSGKSTFINALLKDDLLKTSALVATAAATKICYGNELKVEVNFSGSRAGVIKTQGSNGVVNLPWLSNSQTVDIRRFIHLLTSDEEVATDVVDITIEHPASFLTNKIIIIDTPGTNAENIRHGAITQRVVRQEADLAIIIVPATMPLSQTLSDFIANSLKEYLHRCIFLVSRMDAIKPQQQNSLLQDLRSRLVDKLGISTPVLHSCSAQIALDMWTGNEPVSEHLQVWQERFIALEKMIIARLSRERTLSIAESLIRLLSQLFEQLNTHLRSQWQKYENAQLKIKQEMIPNLPEFTIEQYGICEKQLRNSIATYLLKTTNCVDARKENITKKIRTELFSATTEDALKKFLQSQAEKLLKESQKQLQQDLQPLTEKLSADAIAVGKIFDQKFAQVYRNLQAIGGKVEASNNISYNFQVNTSNVAVSAQSLTQKLDSSDGTKLGLSAAAGAVVGSVLLPVPGLGTLVGLAVGSWASRFFMPSLDERKQKLWEQLTPGLTSYFDAVKNQTYQDAITYTQSLETSLKQRIDSYIETYKTITENILQEHKIELERLNQFQELTQRDLTEIERRQNRLAEQLQKIAAINL
ncbi:dynamin family protein [Aulosira sp. FACHB-615]|uniref:dynamin family protein n=1 Tax=Aulosira sp. FACHB-615 TaxID=2692777 RepID=UPI0016890CE4|nr:dynamin family protein [Aulosira sp. FACHB-615]MBD2487192.1 dynamin family protein [Aulosira sp. FACHB-615]